MWTSHPSLALIFVEISPSWRNVLDLALVIYSVKGEWLREWVTVSIETWDQRMFYWSLWTAPVYIAVAVICCVAVIEYIWTFYPRSSTDLFDVCAASFKIIIYWTRLTHLSSGKASGIAITTGGSSVDLDQGRRRQFNSPTEEDSSVCDCRRQDSVVTSWSWDSGVQI